MREQVVEELRRAPDGLDVATLATRLRLHPNTVRWHLGALQDAGEVSSHPVRASGRGRPRMLYRLSGGARDGDRDEYRLLATILSGALADESDGPRRAEEGGRAWGRYLVERPLPLVRVPEAEATARVAALLDEQGFAAEQADGEIRMRRCPFHDLAEAQPQIVCAVHRGLIEGALEELGTSLRVDELDVFVEPDLCVVKLAS
jgi:predicted ArsR family transcriptional regulator